MLCRLIALFLLFCITSDFLYSQKDFQPYWVGSYGGASYDQAEDIGIDSNGNLFTTGIFSGTYTVETTYGPTTISAPTFQSFIQKIDTNGSLVWMKQTNHVGGNNEGCYASELSVDRSGNILIAGNFRDSTDFDTAISQNIVGPLGHSDIFIQKLSSDGNLIWVKTIASTNNEFAMDLVTDSYNNIYLAGVYLDSVDFDPGPNTILGNGPGFFILKLDSLGDFLWVNDYHSSNFSSVKDIKLGVDSSENLIMAGSCRLDSVDFDPGPAIQIFNPQSLVDLFLQKISPTGDLIWVKNLGDIASEVPTDLRISKEQNIYLSYNVAYSPPEYFYGGPNYTKIEVFDKNGNSLWSQSWKSAGISSIEVDSNSAVIICGSFAETINLNPSDLYTLPYQLYSNEKSSVFIFKLNKNYKFEWAQQFGSDYNIILKKLRQNPNNNLVITGLFENSVKIPINGTEEVKYSNGHFDFFHVFAKESVPVSDFDNIKVFPNPTYGELLIDFGGVHDPAIIRISDLTGRLISETTNFTGNNFPTILEASNGTYIIEIRIGDQVLESKIIKL